MGDAAFTTPRPSLRPSELCIPSDFTFMGAQALRCVLFQTFLCVWAHEIPRSPWTLRDEPGLHGHLLFLLLLLYLFLFFQRDLGYGVVIVGWGQCSNLYLRERQQQWVKNLSVRKVIFSLTMFKMSVSVNGCLSLCVRLWLTGDQSRVFALFQNKKVNLFISMFSKL